MHVHNLGACRCTFLASCFLSRALAFVARLRRPGLLVRPGAARPGAAWSCPASARRGLRRHEASDQGGHAPSPIVRPRQLRFALIVSTLTRHSGMGIAMWHARGWRSGRVEATLGCAWIQLSCRCRGFWRMSRRRAWRSARGLGPVSSVAADRRLGRRCGWVRLRKSGSGPDGVRARESCERGRGVLGAAQGSASLPHNTVQEPFDVSAT